MSANSEMLYEQIVRLRESVEIARKNNEDSLHLESELKSLIEKFESSKQMLEEGKKYLLKG